MTKNESYVNKEDDISQEEVYLKRQSVSFYKELGYVGGVIPSDGVSRKRLKWFAETLLLLDANNDNGIRKVIFGKWNINITRFNSSFEHSSL